MKNKHSLVFIFTSLFLSVNFNAHAQFGVYAGGGIAWYYGEMNDRVIAHSDLITTQFQGGLLYRMNYKWNVVANIHLGSLEGADSLAISDAKIERNLHFRTDLTEVSLLANYYLGNGRLRPYLLGGIGYFSFNPVATAPDGKEVELQKLGTEGQFIQNENSDYPEPYELRQFSVPFGLGFEYGISKSFALRLELAAHYTMTDYLDDVSGKYADSTLLAGTPNGPLAVDMASNLSTGYPEETKQRGDSHKQDIFATVGLTLLYCPGSGFGSGTKGITGAGLKAKKKKRNHCAAYD